MKRREAISVAVLGILSLAGCSSGDGDGDSNSTLETDSTGGETNEQGSDGGIPEFGYGSGAQFANDVIAEIYHPEISETHEYESVSGDTAVDEPDEGHVFAFVPVTTRNGADVRNRLPTSREFTLRMGGGEYDYDYTNIDGRYEGGEVDPDVERSGWIRFQVPEENAGGETAVICDYFLDKRQVNSTGRWVETPDE